MKYFVGIVIRTLFSTMLLDEAILTEVYLSAPLLNRAVLVAACSPIM